MQQASQNEKINKNFQKAEKIGIASSVGQVIVSSSFLINALESVLCTEMGVLYITKTR